MDLPLPAILDLDHLGTQSFGDPVLERDLLALFEGQCRALSPVILSGRDQGARADAAHTLRGSAVAVGAFALAAACAEVELSLRGDRGGGSGLDGLDRAIARVGQAVAARQQELARAEPLAKPERLA